MTEQILLGFSADTSQAKRAVQDLQTSLNQLVNNPVKTGQTITEDIQKASVAAAELKVHLQNATNVKTGALDFGKLNMSLKQSGMTLDKYAAQLQKLGPQGQQAFMSLANSVAMSEVPVKRVNKALAGMMTTLKNTAKWQVSSSILHGFMGAVSEAHQYAQNLNKSLNDIRIVSDQNTDQMAKFARTANEAAKALSTTTNEYAKAALIFYQQGGMTDEQIQEKANITIKMANATGQSAQVVSDQLTAIWNNFDEGTKSLEYYADVMTKLGAETASSTDEIAQGLEKFAAISKTVGLSYEYATAALTTVTATTRQSADTVGTAFKTMFARIQGLKLGETLDDGTTLNQYSEALKAVGVNIKDANGDLKQMDTILDEMAGVWKTLESDEKAALAQKVAGVRQYSQLIALMDNWDFMEKNLNTAYDAAGTLSKQADIYAESWEAASKRVKASAESIYSELFDDKVFIGLTNSLGDVIDLVGQFVDGIGGLGGVLSGLGLIVTKVFKNQMAQGFRDLAYNIQMSTDAGVAAVQKQKEAQMKKLTAMMGKGDASTAADIKTQEVYTRELQLQTELIANADKLNAAEQKKCQILLDQYKTLGMQTVELTKQLETAKELSADNRLEVVGLGMQNKKSFGTMMTSMDSVKNASQGMVELNSVFDSLVGKSSASTKQIEKLRAALKTAGASQGEIDGLNKEFLDIANNGGKATQSIEKIKVVLQQVAQTKMKNVLKATGLEEGTEAYKKAKQALEEYFKTEQKVISLEGQVKASNEGQAQSYKTLSEAIKGAGQEAVEDWANHMATLTSSLMSVGMLISSLNSLIDTINDPDSSGWEKFGSILTSVSMIAMSLGGVFQGIKSVIALTKIATDKETIAKIANAAASHLQTKKSQELSKAKDKETKETEDNTRRLNKDTKKKIKENKKRLKRGESIDFTDSNGNARSFAGKKDKNGNLLDTRGKRISKADAKTNGLATSAFNPGTISTLASAAAPIIAITAALAVAAVAITAGAEAMNTAEDRLKAAAAAAEDLSKQADQARAALKGLQQSFEDLESKRSVLDTLTEGTLEYKMALQESNAAVLELIKSTDGLKMADLEVDEKGAYGIKEEAQRKILEQKMEDASIKQSTSLNAQADKEDAAQNLEVDSFLEKQHKNSKNAGVLTGVALGGGYGAMYGAMLGSMVGPVGTAVGAAAGAIAGAGAAIGTALFSTGEVIDSQAAAFEALDFSTMDTEMEKLTAAATALGINFDGTEAGFKALDESIQKEIQALVANKEATDKNTAALLREATKEGFTNEFEDLSESEKKLAADYIGEDVKTTSDAVKGQLEKRWEGKLHGSEYKEAAAMLNYEEGTEIKAVKGEDGVTRYRAVDSAGEIIEELGTLDAIIARISEEYAYKAAKGEDMSRYNTDLAQDALGGKSVTDFDSDYKLGKNQGEEAADKFDFGLTGQAKALFDEGITSEQLTVEDFQGDNGQNIINAIQAIADASGALTVEDYNANAEAINAYYKALFGENADMDVSAILEKINKVKEVGEEAAAEMDEKNAESIAKQAVSEGLIESAEAFEAYADSLLTAEQKSKLTKEAQAELVKQMLQTKKSAQQASEALEDYKEALKDGDEIAQAEALGKMVSALNEVFGEDAFDASTVKENLEDVKKAIQGDAEAYDRLQQVAATNLLNDQLKEIPQTLQDTVDAVASIEGIDVGDLITIDENALDTGSIAYQLSDMYTQAYNAAIAGGMATAEAMNYANQLMNAVGFNAPEMVEKEVTLTGDIPDGWTPQPDGTVVTTDADGNQVVVQGVKAVKEEGGTYTYTQTMLVPKEKGTGFTKLAETIKPSKSGGSGGGGGGGGSKPKPTKDARGKKTDYVDRYKEIDDKLDNIRDKMEDSSKLADRLWGSKRLSEMKKIGKQLEKEVKLLKAKKIEAQNNLNLDQSQLNTAAGKLGLNLKYNTNGDITNRTAAQESIFNQRESLLDSFGSTMDEAETKRLEEFDKLIEDFKGYLSQYEETRELIEDLDNEIDDKIYEWQDNNYEQLNYKLEFEIEINDSELELFNYYLDKADGDIYATAEAFVYLGKTVDTYTDSLAHQKKYAKQLEADYYAGKISMAAYKEGLRETQSATIENLQALQDQKEALQDYYGNVMGMAIEEISIYTNEMEHLSSVLDHYSNILELVGKKEDYAVKKKALQSKASHVKNELDVQKQLYEQSADQADYWAQKMSEAVVGSNEYETYKKNWQAAQEVANNAQDEMLAKTEEWAEAMKAVVETELAELADIMEKSVTGGKSFDELLTSMERRSSLQEEYLTTTNQIYETNKLINKAQQEIDKTSNTVAKRRMQNFINETSKMQEQTKLSKYELDIQQAKYDLLLAEIALEEAQNAKSTVRLQRDSEGNFGYVYTADQNAVDNAEQELADKQNALYNIGLEGANNYSQKYAETMQEAQDAITELTEMWMNGEIESEEEYQRRKAEIQEYYYDKLKQYSSLYQVALTTDSNVIKDAWSTDFNDMIYQTEEWKDSIDTYFEGAAESMRTWTETCQTVLQQSGLDDVNKTIEEIDDKSAKLTVTLIGEDGESGVVGAMMAEAEAAGTLSEAYIAIQDEIDNTIEKYEKLIEELNKKYTDPNTPKVDPQMPNDDGKGDGNKDDGNKKHDKKTKRGVALAIWNGGYGWGVGKTRRQRLKEKGFDPDEMQALVNNTNPSGGWETRYGIKDLDKYAYSKFDTGGYTGDWTGSYGKFAMLHKKELVLNEQDTENFLAGMDILSKIVSVIDLYSMNSSLGGMLSTPSLGGFNGETGQLEQSVHIEANFPGVSERSEIEEAFTNLINKASQFANRK